MFIKPVWHLKNGQYGVGYVSVSPGCDLSEPTPLLTRTQIENMMYLFSADSKAAEKCASAISCLWIRLRVVSFMDEQKVQAI